MSGFFSAIAVVGGVVMCLTVLHWIVEAIKRGAVDEELLNRLSKEAKLAERQTAEVMKERTVEDVARDLDAGEF